LAVVAEGGGDRDARQIDLTVDARFGRGRAVLQELEALAGPGLVIRRYTLEGQERDRTSPGRKTPDISSSGGRFARVDE
jgi:hypothetical protein